MRRVWLALVAAVGIVAVASGALRDGYENPVAMYFDSDGKGAIMALPPDTTLTLYATVFDSMTQGEFLYDTLKTSSSRNQRFLEIAVTCSTSADTVPTLHVQRWNYDSWVTALVNSFGDTLVPRTNPATNEYAWHYQLELPLAPWYRQVIYAADEDSVYRILRTRAVP